MRWTAIVDFRLVTADADRLAAFFDAIGFAHVGQEPIAQDEMVMLGVTGIGTRHVFTCGGQHLALDQFEVGGHPYPSGTSAADLVFQHFALVTEDIDAAWSRALAAGATPISRDGPVTLPPSSGGVTAVKFRDPDGHPLELLQYPRANAAQHRGAGIVGIDHSAISVSDVAASRSFYESVGLSVGTITLNEGPTQTALDGVEGACVDVVPMEPVEPRPHLELLGYRHPQGRRHAPLAANDIAATRLVWRADRNALIRDPDGHLHQLSRDS